MAIITSGAPTSKTTGNIGDHLVDSTTRKVYECIAVNTYGGHDAVTFKQEETEYVWKCIGDDPNYGSALPSGGTPYQQLVTDGDGNTQWEDRLAYEEVKKYSLPHDISGLESARIGPDLSTFYKVSDDLPDPNDVIQGALYSGPDGFYLDAKVSDGYENNVNCLYDTNVGAFIVCYQTNITYGNKSYSVPSTGVYLSESMNVMGEGDMYLQVQHVNTIDEKFLPAMDSVILNSSTSSSTKKFKITVDDSGTISATEVT